METQVVDGRVQRVYKNIWPSLRNFWIWAAAEYGDKTYIVYEDERISYSDTMNRSLCAAAVFAEKYGVCKGDRVAICSRNLPEYLVAWWACHLLGAVAVLVNAYAAV